MEYNEGQREQIKDAMVGCTVTKLEYEHEDKYWVMELTKDKSSTETSFRFMAELVE